MAAKKKTSGLKVVIKIEIGNDSMREYGELQQALANSIFAASALHPHDYAMRGDGGVIRDHNGNKVGSWKVKG